MREIRNQVFFIFFLSASFYLLYLLSNMLPPFILGGLLAYLANPLVKRLERFRLPHLASVSLVFGLFIAIILIVLIFSVPILHNQWNDFITFMPQVVTWTQDKLLPVLREYITISPESVKTFFASNLPKTGWLFVTAIYSGRAVVGWLVTLVLTPVVMFYLLRDWDRLLKNLLGIFPHAWQSVIKQLAGDVDQVLSAFVRGQLLIMLALCLIYGIGLSLIGLRVGLIIGIIGGMLSIVPYLGSIFVLLAASIAGLVQFGDWHILGWVGVVYAIGQVIEGYILTPYLIGERIGLHPVMVIFSVMAGGTLFGFFGVLVALPVAAVLKVLLSYFQKRYITSLN